MKTTVLIFFFILSFAPAEAQSYLKTPGGYFSGHVGIGPYNEGLILGTWAGGGYQFNKWAGLGASLTSQVGAGYFSSGFTGLSLQYRVRPTARFAGSFDFGYILRHRQGTDSNCDIRYIPGRYAFYKIQAGWKLGSLFTLGICASGLPEVKHEIWFLDDITGACSVIRERTYEWTTSGVMLTLGLNLN
jgi:hypothetical protein